MTLACRAALIVLLAAVGTASPGAQRSAPPSLAWQAVRNGPMGGNVTELLETSEGVLIARANNVLYRSTDDGRTWVQCRRLASSFSLQQSRQTTNWLRHTIADAERGIPVPDGARSNDLRVTDHRCESFGFIPGPPGTADRGGRSLSLLPSGSVAISQAGVFQSSDRGQTWTQTLALAGERACAEYPGLQPSAVLLIAGTRLYRSSDAGASWMQVPEHAASAETGASPAGTNPGLSCPLLRSRNWWTLYSAGPGGLWRSIDQGVSWTRVFEGSFSALASTDRRVWLQTLTPEGPALIRSEDEGASWTTLPFLRESRGSAQRLLDTKRGTLLAATFSGLFRSDDRGQSWTRTGFDQWDLSLAADSQRAYASEASGVWTSVDAGNTWRKALTNTVDGRPWNQNDRLTRLFDAGDGRSRGVVDRRLLVSDDGGTTWRSSGLDKDVLSLVRVGKTWYAGTNDGVFRSSDLGAWSECSYGLTADGPLVITGSGDLFVTGGARSIDECRSWWQFPTTGHKPAGPYVFSAPSVGVLAIGAGITRLDLATRQWSQWKDAGEITATSVVEDGRGRYWIGTDHGVYALVVDGGAWDVWPMGLQGERIVSLAIDPKGYLLAAVEGRGISRAALP